MIGLFVMQLLSAGVRVEWEADGKVRRVLLRRHAPRAGHGPKAGGQLLRHGREPRGLGPYFLFLIN